MLSFCGVFWCFVASAGVFVLLQGAYLLRDDAGIGFFGVFIPWLTALFTTLVTVSVFSVILCVVPNDGGHILAAAAPYEACGSFLSDIRKNVFHKRGRRQSLGYIQLCMDGHRGTFCQIEKHTEKRK